VLTEKEVTRSWRKLFNGPVSEEAIAKAEGLLDHLRPESPLLHKLRTELEELRDLPAAKG